MQLVTTFLTELLFVATLPIANVKSQHLIINDNLHKAIMMFLTQHIIRLFNSP